MSSKLDSVDSWRYDDGLAGQPSVWSGVISKLANIIVYGGVLYATYILFRIRITSSPVIESEIGKFL